MKWLIYPYTPKSIPIIKNKSLLKCGEVVQVSAPLGFGLEGKNGYIWGNEKSEYIIRNKIEQEIDGIWITPEIGYMSMADKRAAISKVWEKMCAVYSRLDRQGMDCRKKFDQ